MDVHESNLCGSVNEWQKEQIRKIDQNLIAYPDMAWVVGRKTLHGVCSACASPLFGVLFDIQMDAHICLSGEICSFCVREQVSTYIRHDPSVIIYSYNV